MLKTISFFLFIRIVIKLTSAKKGNSSNDALKEMYLDIRERTKGIIIPPIGIPILIIPSAVPAISMYAIPARLRLRGNIAEIVIPQMKMRMIVGTNMPFVSTK